MDSKENKKAPEGDELNAEELETVTGALFTPPGGGFGGGAGGGGLRDMPPSCYATTDSGTMGCIG